MKLAVFSDSHGRPDAMLRAVKHHSPDMIIHLGDGGTDVDRIKDQFPQTPLKAVKGNCDFNSALPEIELFDIGKVKILITHGHLFGVKRNLSSLIERAIGLEADIVMYGHTHIADYFKVGKLNILNPGTCGYSPSASFAEVTISDSGEILCRILKL
ncbi:MAG: metallophosphoesterase [Clostridiales bacterium]|nr:metallophosphoesterase [Clostridiales bacterium]